MSFSFQAVGKPKAVAEAIRKKGLEVAGQVTVETEARMISGVFESAAGVAGESIETRSDGVEMAVSAVINGHIGVNGYNSLSVSIILLPLVS